VSAEWDLEQHRLNVPGQPGDVLVLEHIVVTGGSEQSWSTAEGVVPEDGWLTFDLQIPDDVALEVGRQLDLKTRITGHVRDVAPLIYVTWTGADLELTDRRETVEVDGQLVRHMGRIDPERAAQGIPAWRLALEDTGVPQ
jgi:hypothetical protein